MREIAGIGYGPSDDWLFLDLAETASEADEDDANFERWLASMTPKELEYTLSGLFDDSLDRYADRTA